MLRSTNDASNIGLRDGSRASAHAPLCAWPRPQRNFYATYEHRGLIFLFPFYNAPYRKNRIRKMVCTFAFMGNAPNALKNLVDMRRQKIHIGL
jgi:hypothetical protein